MTAEGAGGNLKFEFLLRRRVVVNGAGLANTGSDHSHTRSGVRVTCHESGDE